MGGWGCVMAIGGPKESQLGRDPVTYRLVDRL